MHRVLAAVPLLYKTRNLLGKAITSISLFIGIPSASLAIMGRFAINISYNIGLQYAAELLPTVVRAQGVALIHIMGYVSSIVAPFVVYLVSNNVQTTQK